MRYGCALLFRQYEDMQLTPGLCSSISQSASPPLQHSCEAFFPNFFSNGQLPRLYSRFVVPVLTPTPRMPHLLTRPHHQSSSSSSESEPRDMWTRSRFGRMCLAAPRVASAATFFPRPVTYTSAIAGCGGSHSITCRLAMGARMATAGAMSWNPCKRSLNCTTSAGAHAASS